MRAVLIPLVLALPLAAADAPAFNANVAPLLQQRCAGCHAAKVHMGGLSLEDYEGIMKGGSHGPAVIAGKAEESRIVLMLTAKISPAMPMDGTNLSPAEIDTIKAWIDAGAKPPAPGESGPKPAAAAIPKIEPRVPVKPQIFDLAWRPDGSLIALAGFRQVRLVDPATKAVIATLDGETDAVRALAFSRDGKLLAAAGGLAAREGEVKIWDVDSRKLVQTVAGHADCIYAVAFSLDGKSIATSSYDKLIKLWDVSSGKEIRTFKDHIDAVYALVFTPDGKRLVSGAADRTVKIWNAQTGERLYTLSEPQDGINAIAIDPTGERVAAGGLDKTIRVWKLGEKSGTLEASLIAHEDSILRLAWSPDGKTLISSSADGSIKILSAADLSEIGAIQAQADWVYGLQFSPDGKRFAAGRFDGSLTFYNSATAGHAAVRAAR